jgi:hypothetical protein
MHTTRHAAITSTALLLRCWLCAWLALLMATQLYASALAGLHGARHQHRPAMLASEPSTPVIRWLHGNASRTEAHAQLHATGQAHDHSLADASVLPLGSDSATEAVAQLAITWAPAAERPFVVPDGARHVQLGTPPWAATTRSIAPPLKPPRA